MTDLLRERHHIGAGDPDDFAVKEKREWPASTGEIDDETTAEIEAGQYATSRDAAKAYSRKIALYTMAPQPSQNTKQPSSRSTTRP
jgi:hypothetical protein